MPFAHLRQRVESVEHLDGHQNAQGQRAGLRLADCEVVAGLVKVHDPAAGYVRCCLRSVERLSCACSTFCAVFPAPRPEHACNHEHANISASLESLVGHPAVLCKSWCTARTHGMMSAAWPREHGMAMRTHENSTIAHQTSMTTHKPVWAAHQVGPGAAMLPTAELVSGYRAVSP